LKKALKLNNFENPTFAQIFEVCVPTDSLKPFINLIYSIEESIVILIISIISSDEIAIFIE
jgi:hypothetical protein